MDALGADQAFTNILERVSKCHGYLHEAGHGDLRDFVLDNLVKVTEELVAQVGFDRSSIEIWTRLLTR